MTKPGDGASMTTGEAAAYARGRARGLREAARVAQEQLCPASLLPSHVEERAYSLGYTAARSHAADAIRALLAPPAAVPEAEQRWIDAALRQEARAIAAEQELAAARARIAELERGVEMLRETQSQALRDAEIDGRRAGAEAMREAAAKVARDAEAHISTLKARDYPDDMGRLLDDVEAAIRALPLPQEAGDE